MVSTGSTKHPSWRTKLRTQMDRKTRWPYRFARTAGARLDHPTQTGLTTGLDPNLGQGAHGKPKQPNIPGFVSLRCVFPSQRILLTTFPLISLPGRCLRRRHHPEPVGTSPRTCRACAPCVAMRGLSQSSRWFPNPPTSPSGSTSTCSGGLKAHPWRLNLVHLNHRRFCKRLKISHLAETSPHSGHLWSAPEKITVVGE